MQMQPSKPNRTAGEKLRAFASKLNEGTKMGICSMLLVTSLAVTHAVMSQDTKPLSKESEPAIRTDFQTIKSPQIPIKAIRADVNPKNQPTWDWVTRGRPVRENQIPVSMQIHSIHADEENPYVIAQVLKSDNTPYLTMIPKDICTDEGWGKIMKMTPRPEFAEKWGYKLPTTLGETTQYGSTVGSIAAAEAAAEDAKKRAHQIVAPTMPVERTITNTKGVAIEGTILSKTDSAISFQRKGNGGPVDIKLDQLSPEDQTFIATLIAKSAAKPTVLFVTNQDYEVSLELRTWLTNSGFDVILGFMSRTSVENSRKNLKVPIEQKAIMIDPFTVVDQFDVVWIHRFSPEDRKENSDPALVAHRNKNRRLVVIPTHSRLAKKDRFLSSENYYAGSPKTGEEEESYMKIDENIIFCSNKAPYSTDEKMREKLLAAIKAQLAK